MSSKNGKLDKVGLTTVGLKTHIWNNNLFSLAMLLVLPTTLFLMVWAFLFGWQTAFPSGQYAQYSYSLMEHGTLAFQSALDYLPVVLLIVAGWYTVSWLLNVQMIMAATGAKMVSRKKEPELYNLLENLCMSVGMPMPQLAIIETDALNAFASGVNEKSYAVTVTRGLMDVMDKDELEAVIAHELTHIRNHDVRLMMVVSIFAGMIGTIIGLFKSIFLSRPHTSLYMLGSSRNNRDGGRIVLFILGMMAVVFIASIVTNLVKLYISRKREFMADAGAVELTNKPEAMVKALRKIEGHSEMPEVPANVSEMCISPSTMSELWSTHPSTDSRIEALKVFAGYGLTDQDYEISYPKPEPVEQAPQSSALASNPWQSGSSGSLGAGGLNPMTEAVLTGTLADMAGKANGTFGKAPAKTRDKMAAASVAPSQGAMGMTSSQRQRQPLASAQPTPKKVWGSWDKPEISEEKAARRQSKAVKTVEKTVAKVRESIDPWSPMPPAPRKTFGQR